MKQLSVFVGCDHVAEVINLSVDWPWLHGVFQPTNLSSKHAHLFEKLSEKYESDTRNESMHLLFAAGFCLVDPHSGERFNSTPDQFIRGEVVRFILDGIQCRFRIM